MVSLHGVAASSLSLTPAVRFKLKPIKSMSIAECYTPAVANLRATKSATIGV